MDSYAIVAALGTRLVLRPWHRATAANDSERSNVSATTPPGAGMARHSASVSASVWCPPDIKWTPIMRPPLLMSVDTYPAEATVAA